MPLFVCLIGPSCAGKTTLRRQLSLAMGLIARSTDDIVEAYAAAVGKTYSEAFPEWIDTATVNLLDAMAKDVANRQSFIVDRTSLDRVSRERYLRLLTEDYYKIAYVLMPPRDILLARNTVRSAEQPGKALDPLLIDRQILRFEKPSYEEFDLIAWV